MCTYTYRGAPLGDLYTAACIPRMASRTFIVLPEPQVSLREAAYNYFYELLIMT